MNWFLNFYRSAVGKKTVMAVTGVLLFGFVLIHMIGNLKLYLPPGADGRAALDIYGEFLKNFGYPLLPHEGALWIFRIVLVLAAWLHIQSATQLTLMNWGARPEKYKERDWVVADYASRTMRWGGVIVLLFIIWHLLDFTLGTVNPGFVYGEVRRNMIASFSVPWVAGFYIIANLMLGLHLYHGLWSFFQSLGWNHPSFNEWRKWFASAFSILITLGNVSFPIAVMTGLVK
jgi:succinate dehydrogenase / fumarate reductase cytochrome b subunit